MALIGAEWLTVFFLLPAGSHMKCRNGLYSNRNNYSGIGQKS